MSREVTTAMESHRMKTGTPEIGRAHLLDLTAEIAKMSGNPHRSLDRALARVDAAAVAHADAD